MHRQAILLTSVLGQLFKSALVSFEREFPVRGLEDLPEVDFLDAGGSRVARQFLVGEAGAGVFSGRDLAFKQVAQKLYCFRSALQRKADIGCHLAHIVILRVLGEDLHIFVQSFASLALLQELFGALYSARDLGSVHSLGRICHERHG